MLLAVGCGDVVTLSLPTVAELDATPQPLPMQSEVFDADGDRLAVLRRDLRDPVSLLDVPRHLTHAVLTAEDRRFYQHGGIDARSVARAALRNAAAGEIEQGGSTITQQLVKNLYLADAPRTPETKIKEALLARKLEDELPKATILETYLNVIPFGEGAYGIGAAAHTYFRKDVADLVPAESALLAAIIRAPEAFAPTRAPDAARVRRDDVLYRMWQDGHLTAEERDEATASPIEVHGRPPAPTTREPHVVDLVVRTLLADPSFGATPEERADRLYGGGLRIHTTIRPDLQALAREVLAAHLPDPDDPDAAIAVVDPATGHLVASVGSRPYDELQFDLPTQARRQPGSTFKTFVLAAAVAAGWHPDDVLDGTQGEVDTPLGTWEVRNFDRRSYGRVTLAGATRASVNTAYARLGAEVGIARVAALATAMGVGSPVPGDDVQITLGGGSLGVTPVDLASAYATLADLGTHRPVTVVSRIEDATGGLVWQPPGAPEQVLDPSAAFVTLGVLQDSVEHGTGLAARVEGWPVAGKTGTTSDHADAWFVGTTPALSAAVWVGHVEGRVPLEDVQGVARVTGGSIPAEVFAAFMVVALGDVEPADFVLPDRDWVAVSIDPDSGLLAADWCAGEPQLLPRVLVPRETCPEPPPPPDPPPPPPVVVRVPAAPSDPADLEPVPGEDPADGTDPEPGTGGGPGGDGRGTAPGSDSGSGDPGGEVAGPGGGTGSPAPGTGGGAPGSGAGPGAGNGSGGAGGGSGGVPPAPLDPADPDGGDEPGTDG